MTPSRTTASTPSVARRTGGSPARRRARRRPSSTVHGRRRGCGAARSRFVRSHHRRAARAVLAARDHALPAGGELTRRTARGFVASTHHRGPPPRSMRRSLGLDRLLAYRLDDRTRPAGQPVRRGPPGPSGCSRSGRSRCRPAALLRDSVRAHAVRGPPPPPWPGACPAAVCPAPRTSTLVAAKWKGHRPVDHGPLDPILSHAAVTPERTSRVPIRRTRVPEIAETAYRNVHLRTGKRKTVQAHLRVLRGVRGERGVLRSCTGRVRARERQPVHVNRAFVQCTGCWAPARRSPGRR